MSSAARSRALPPSKFVVPAAFALALALCAPAAAQYSIRESVEPPPKGQPQKPVPMKMLDSEAGHTTGQATGQATGQTTGQSGGREGAPTGKFPNKDTAKNRRDYEMGTAAGADTITLGRDEESGDTVMVHTPKKQEQQQNPLEGQPIQVRPIVPMGGRGSGSGR
jgi:hypothetical protein